MPLVRAVPFTHDQVNVDWTINDRSETEPGAEPEMRVARYGEAEPSPHIERQSRNTRSNSIGFGILGSVE